MEIDVEYELISLHNTPRRNELGFGSEISLVPWVRDTTTNHAKYEATERPVVYTMDLEARDLGRESINTRTDSRIEMLRRERNRIDPGTLRRSAESTESIYKENQKRQCTISWHEPTPQIHRSQ